ncbi:MAG TPA: YciI family protein [Candidatus Angelobacter sp.]|nr:YciI family protein [Candidatus Angelobacter sp.]
MMLIGGEETSYVNDSEEEREAMYRRIGAWWNEHEQAGRIVEGHELQPSSMATTVRIRRDGSTTVTDGPFIEGKEMIGGYAVLEVADLDEALALAKSWPTADSLEIRPIVERA